MGQMTSVALTEHFENFIDEQTGSGRYKTPTDVLEAGLRLLEREEMKLAWLRKAIADGDASGPAVPFDFQELYDELDAEELADERNATPAR